jgi:hypothetical protein
MESKKQKLRGKVDVSILEVKVTNNKWYGSVLRILGNLCSGAHIEMQIACVHSVIVYGRWNLLVGCC